jgi:hypothetical protein
LRKYLVFAKKTQNANNMPMTKKHLSMFDKKNATEKIVWNQTHPKQQRQGKERGRRDKYI